MLGILVHDEARLCCHQPYIILLLLFKWHCLNSWTTLLKGFEALLPGWKERMLRKVSFRRTCRGSQIGKSWQQFSKVDFLITDIYFFTEQRRHFIKDSGLHKRAKTTQCTNGRIDQGQRKIANRHRALTPAGRGTPTRKCITESTTAAAWSWVGNRRSQRLKLQIIMQCLATLYKDTH